VVRLDELENNEDSYSHFYLFMFLSNIKHQKASHVAAINRVFFYFGRFGLPSKRTQKKTIENASRQRRLKTPLKWRFLKTANLRIENGGFGLPSKLKFSKTG